MFYIEKLKRKTAYIKRSAVKKNIKDIDKYKVFIPEAAGSGNDPYVVGKPEYAGKNTICTQSYLYVPFENEAETKNFIAYISTKFFRVLVSACKVSQHTPSKTYRFVPMQDFTENSDIKWDKSIAEIDQQLYEKYGLTEELKAKDQMKWVALANYIAKSAQEIVQSELIFR